MNNLKKFYWELMQGRTRNLTEEEKILFWYVNRLRIWEEGKKKINRTDMVKERTGESVNDVLHRVANI